MSYNDLYSFVPKLWKEYVSEDDLFDIINYLNNETCEIYPSKKNIFKSLELIDPKNVKVIILGQDPYIHKNEAMGMSFSVPENTKIPPSLLNIFKELKSQYPSFKIPKHGNLTKWEQQGVLLLNSVLTVKEGKSNSHSNIGWNYITGKILNMLNSKNKIIFVAWGRNAENTMKEYIENWKSIDKNIYINDKGNYLLYAPHPSPLAKGAFFNNNHFVKINEILRDWNIDIIDWNLC